MKTVMREIGKIGKVDDDDKFFIIKKITNANIDISLNIINVIKFNNAINPIYFSFLNFLSLHLFHLIFLSFTLFLH